VLGAVCAAGIAYAIAGIDFLLGRALGLS
jgi:hypothetical protein